MSTLSFTKYRMFVYTQRYEKMEFMIFLIPLRSLTCKASIEQVTESEKEAVTQPNLMSFYLFNSKNRDSFTIYH